jgi:hypothetical protein
VEGYENSSALSSAENDALIASLLARIEELSKRLAELEEDDAALHGTPSSLQPSSGYGWPAVERAGPLSRPAPGLQFFHLPQGRSSNRSDPAGLHWALPADNVEPMAAAPQ